MSAVNNFKYVVKNVSIEYNCKNPYHCSWLVGIGEAVTPQNYLQLAIVCFYIASYKL